MFARHRRRIERFARRIAGRGAKGETQAEESIQDASVEFAKKPRTYGSESHFVNLFFGFIRNASRRRRRHDQAEKRGGAGASERLPTDLGVGPGNPDTGPATAAQRAEHYASLRAQVSELQEEHQRVIELRLVHDLPWQEVAERMGTPTADAARKKYEYAIGLLRERVADARAGDSAG